MSSPDPGIAGNDTGREQGERCGFNVLRTTGSNLGDVEHDGVAGSSPFRPPVVP